MMQTLIFNQAIQSFTTLMDDVSNNHEPLIITHEHHKSVVLMSLDDFNAWQETDYLTRPTANANDLLQAVNDIKERKNIFRGLYD